MKYNQEKTALINGNGVSTKHWPNHLKITPTHIKKIINPLLKIFKDTYLFFEEQKM